MKWCVLLFILMPVMTACENNQTDKPPLASANQPERFLENCIKNIAVPEGYIRKPLPEKDFGTYLRNLPLKKDKRVYLYDGSLKKHQSAQYAVIDISVGDRDLQQCADAVMRLRAEYFYGLGKFNAIEFFTGTRKKLNYGEWLKGKQNSRTEFMRFLTYVFNWCGTASLLYSVKNKKTSDMQSGDIFLKPGSPGHTVIVVDMATNAAGKKLYMLAQSYMPAQHVHVLKNPLNADGNPWYELNRDEVIDTPEWRFYANQLYGWK